MQGYLNCDVRLHTEIEVLKNALADKHSQLLAMENACLQESDRQVELEDSIIAWQDKYERLYESHKRVQKVNQNLEDKLLKLVDRNSGERAQLTSDVATLSVRLAQANYNIQSLKREIERYKTDMSVAIQLLQCKPDSFVSPKLSTLPIEIQSKVATYMRLDTNSHSDSEGSTSGVGVATASSYHVLPASDSPPPMCPFPPTAMVYSMRGIGKYASQSSSSHDGGGGGGGGGAVSNGGGGTGKLQSHQDVLSLGHINSGDSLLGSSRGNRIDRNVVSPSVMAKFLEDELKSSEALLNSHVKHCETCVCPRNGNLTSGSLILADLLGDGQKYFSVGTQTIIKGETNNSLCLRCNNNLNSPSHNNSPYIMKLIKSSDSVISETKSSVSDFLTTPDQTSPNNGTDQATLAPSKKDDLMVNPILGHHRITERTGNYNSASPNSDPPVQSGLGLTKNSSYSSGNGTKLPPVSQTKKAQDILKPKIQATVSAGSKYTGESPSYIIKDTDQMSGIHTLQTPKSGVGGTFGSVTSQPNKVTGSSVGSGLYHAVGSTNSLWSRSSSRDPERDGAKIFESFNRNLIKTIKAENPKMSGPRICSLRIQNGSSNILLDSLQDDIVDDLLESKSSVGPVIYTRRAKFLDEELLLDDDPSIGLNGAIKTTSLPTASTSVNNSSNSSKQTSMVVNGSGSGVLSSGHGSGGNQGTDQSRQDSSPKDVCNMSTTTSPNSSDRLCTIGEEVNNLLLNTKITSNLAPSKPRLDINVNKLEGLDLNSKKSCTQSSSISSEIDIQESVMLRRQQLSRVAEWVQNNSKIGNTENMSNTESDSENLALASAASLTLVDSINNNNAPCNGISTLESKGNCIETKPVASDMKISRSSSNSAMAQHILSDNVLSNSNAFNNNHIINSNNNKNTNSFAQANSTNASTVRGYSHSSLKAVIASNATQLNFTNNNHGTYHGNLSNIPTFSSGALTRPRQPDDIKALLEQPLRHNLECDLDDGNSVDIAQMEYNVKQFLLKQNEWSSMSRRMSSSTTSGTVDSTAHRQQNPPQQQPVVEEPLQRILSVNSRSNDGGLKGSFPGTAVQQTTQFHMNKYPINPHRTETNL
ncbi:putative uncharacterized protein DDB_G0282133 isoform X3 [Armigeres subalbatus]|uniref:putative uncharacterized protein DDB_G0282133 isoform X3 n=1 Tax=Armigeres subalbatus TaxID=124917 RepID=UPI002ECFC845